MFAVGQRWISDTEPDLGLGIVKNIERRIVEISFPATQDARRYAANNSPLTRITFNVGDTITSLDDEQLVVDEVLEQNSILFYRSGEAWLPETHLSPRLHLSKAADRLLVGKTDSNDAYELRQLALKKQHELTTADYQGLLGARTMLLPHQLYIAKEVSDREAPRVLLADEVGLGKTIEAGLIIHRLLLQERIKRVLILLPGNLLHQWLVEMLRRFNLSFSLLDEERCSALQEQQGGDNPFEQQQLVISPIECISENETRYQQAIDAEWDLIVVDEAHHLHWSEDDEHHPDYQLVQTLSEKSPGLILLTATPEQLGVEGHFARLRLLDPERFHSLDTFLQEESNYLPVAKAARSLVGEEPLTEQQIEQLRPWIEDEICTEPTTEQRKNWLTQLIDHHGTGRVLFRNTRSTIKGFPSRQLLQYPMPIPSVYTDEPNVDPEALLYPERFEPDWTSFDYRVDWLEELLIKNTDEKFLLICHKAATALTLNQYLQTQTSIRSSVFQEQMSIMERDRAAAYFADGEKGAQILICSEIGSEGRNFQFLHHLVLFDLPINCDLLEQRIGRLDRIGQTSDIQIHVPYFTDHGSERLLDIFHRGFNLFEQTSPTAQCLLEDHFDDVVSAIFSDDTAEKEALIARLIPERKALDQALEQGRDWLLEHHSCDHQVADQLIDELIEIDKTGERQLQNFIDRICGVYGIEQEEHSAFCHILRPGDHMLIPSFPHLPDEGMTYTCRRELAISRDDLHFLTWEHPLITSALDLVLSDIHGNSCVTYLQQHDWKTGDFYLQVQFVLTCQAPKHLQLQRYLPSAGLIINRMPSGQWQTGDIDFPSEPKSIDNANASSLIKGMEDQLKEQVDNAKQLAEGQITTLSEQALASMEAELDLEIERLIALAKRNPNIRQQEIELLQQKKSELASRLKNISLQLDSVRVVFCG